MAGSGHTWGMAKSKRKRQASLCASHYRYRGYSCCSCTCIGIQQVTLLTVLCSRVAWKVGGGNAAPQLRTHLRDTASVDQMACVTLVACSDVGAWAKPAAAAAAAAASPKRRFANARNS